jgi:hypothetical protein
MSSQCFHVVRPILFDVETLHLDKGYDSFLIGRCHGLGLTDVLCANKQPKGAPKTKKPPNCEAKTKKTHTYPRALLSEGPDFLSVMRKAVADVEAAMPDVWVCGLAAQIS